MILAQNLNLQEFGNWSIFLTKPGHWESLDGVALRANLMLVQSAPILLRPAQCIGVKMEHFPINCNGLR